MDDENDDAVEPIDTPTEIDMLLEEAEAFRRGGAPLEALARARVARQVLDEQLNAYRDEEMDPEETDEADELRARVNSAVARYERLVAAWQRENDSRKNAYLSREYSSLLDHGRQR